MHTPRPSHPLASPLPRRARRPPTGLAWLGVLAALCATARAEEAAWPQFRGPRGDGTVTGARLPLHWSETNNVRWKVAIPQPGWSSPVARDGRVWLTGASEKGNDFFVYGVDAQTGRLLLEKRLFHCDAPEPLGNAVNGYASPTPAVGPGRVYVHFGSYGTACLDAADGRVLWTREDLPCRHYRGPGSSAVLHRDRLILTFDGVDAQYVTALDAATGRTVWKTDRAIVWNDLDEHGKPKREGDFRKGFATPLVVEAAGRTQLISPASTTLFAYDAATGAELWRVLSPKTHTPAVSPVFGAGLVLAVSGHGAAELLAVRPDGAGDVTASHVVWRAGGKDVPLTPSPVALDGLVYMLSDSGALTCLEAADGRVVWREMLGGSYLASLLQDGERLYAFGASGKATVLRAGRAFERLAENRLDAGFMASPAVDGHALLLRTKTHLYRVEAR